MLIYRVIFAPLFCLIFFFLRSGRYDAQFVEERRKGLEAFLNSVVNHPWARFEEGLHKFLEDQDFDCVDK